MAHKRLTLEELVELSKRIGEMDVEPPPPPPPTSSLNMPQAEPVIPRPPPLAQQPPAEDQETATGLPGLPSPPVRDPPPDLGEIPSNSTSNDGQPIILITILGTAALVFAVVVNNMTSEVTETIEIATSMSGKRWDTDGDAPTNLPQTAAIADLTPINVTPPTGDLVIQPSSPATDVAIGQQDEPDTPTIATTFPTFRRLHQRPITHLSEQHIAEAVRGAESDLRRQPSDAVALENLGVALCRANRPSEAIDYFTNAIRMQPKQARLYHNRGVAFTMLKEYDLAISDFRIALGFEPSRKDTAEHLRLVRMTAVQ